MHLPGMQTMQFLSESIFPAGAGTRAGARCGLPTEIDAMTGATEAQAITQALKKVQAAVKNATAQLTLKQQLLSQAHEKVACFYLSTAQTKEMLPSSDRLRSTPTSRAW